MENKELESLNELIESDDSNNWDLALEIARGLYGYEKGGEIIKEMIDKSMGHSNFRNHFSDWSNRFIWKMSNKLYSLKDNRWTLND